MKERLKKFNRISNYKIVAICVLLIAVMMYYYEEVREEEVVIPTQQVIVLKNDIPENTVITEAMLSKETRIEDEFVKKADIVKTIDDVLGKRTRVPLYEGELISNKRLLVNDDSANEVGKTKISLQINEIDRALGLMKGDFIDVWVCPIVPEVDTVNYTETYKLFEKVQIIEVINNDKQVIDKNEDYKDFESAIALYAIIQLTDEEIIELQDVDKAVSTIKFSKYKENELYSIVSEQIEENQANEELQKEAGEDNGQKTN